MKRIGLACALGLVLAPAAATTAPVVRNADVRVAFSSPTSCTVELVLSVDGHGMEMEHRVEAAPGSRLEIVGVDGASVVGDVRQVGRTRALFLRSDEKTPYTLRYTVDQPPERAGRCPLWIPTVPTGGRGQAVRIVARIPEGATAVGTMPAFTWSGTEGTATIGHLPAFVRVPYALAGAPAPWNIARLMDVVSIATLVGATLAWARRRPRRRHHEPR
jgi:hypothetical protein